VDLCPDAVLRGGSRPREAHEVRHCGSGGDPHLGQGGQVPLTGLTPR
jgi:hypothetical protein